MPHSHSSESQSQSTTDQSLSYSPNVPPFTTFTPSISFEDIRRRMHQFVDERDWHKFHTPRNLILALTGEMGELAEIFQWRGEVQTGIPDFTEEEKTHVGEELSDCIMYLVRLSQQCGIDLPKAIEDKMRKNAKKYPVQRFKGSSEKYNVDEQRPGSLTKVHTRITHMAGPTSGMGEGEGDESK